MDAHPRGKPPAESIIRSPSQCTDEIAYLVADSLVGQFGGPLASAPDHRSPADPAVIEQRRRFGPIAQVLSVLKELVSQERAQAWLLTPNAFFGNSPPVDIIAQGNEAAVLDYVRRADATKL